MRQFFWRYSRKVQQPRGYTHFQLYVLAKLDGLVRNKKAYEMKPGSDPILVRALRKATYAVYRDCQDQGLQKEAQQVMRLATAAETREAVAWER